MSMTELEQRAYNWALKQQFHSVAADYARILAKYIQRQSDWIFQLESAWEQAINFYPDLESLVPIGSEKRT